MKLFALLQAAPQKAEGKTKAAAEIQGHTVTLEKKAKGRGMERESVLTCANLSAKCANFLSAAVFVVLFIYESV